MQPVDYQERIGTKDSVRRGQRLRSHSHPILDKYCFLKIQIYIFAASLFCYYLDRVDL